MLTPKTRLNLLLAAIAVLNIFDLLATWCLVSKYGLYMELNPLMRPLFTRGLGLIASVKIGILALFLIIIPLGARRNFRLAYRGAWVVAVAMAAVTLVHTANFITK